MNMPGRRPGDFSPALNRCKGRRFCRRDRRSAVLHKSRPLTAESRQNRTRQLGKTLRRGPGPRGYQDGQALLSSAPRAGRPPL